MAHPARPPAWSRDRAPRCRGTSSGPSAAASCGRASVDGGRHHALDIGLRCGATNPGRARRVVVLLGQTLDGLGNPSDGRAGGARFRLSRPAANARARRRYGRARPASRRWANRRPRAAVVHLRCSATARVAPRRGWSGAERYYSSRTPASARDVVARRRHASTGAPSAGTRATVRRIAWKLWSPPPHDRGDRRQRRGDGAAISASPTPGPRAPGATHTE